MAYFAVKVNGGLANRLNIGEIIPLKGEPTLETVKQVVCSKKIQATKVAQELRKLGIESEVIRL